MPTRRLPLPYRAGPCTRVLLSLLAALPLALLGGSPAGAASGTPIASCGTTISAPGAYYLAQDLSCGSGDGVDITASQVVLNLNGKQLTESAQAVGILVEPGVGHVVIQGPGTVRPTGEGASGIVLTGVQLSTVRGVTLDCGGAIFSVGVGIFTNGGAPSQGNTLSNNTVSNCDTGFSVGGAGHQTVTGNSASHGETGIFVEQGDGDVLQANTVSQNSYGIQVFALSVSHAKIQGNTAKGNSTFDLNDLNPGCGSDIWRGNSFGTADPASCIH